MSALTDAGYREEMSFEVSADAYAAFMGRYSEPLTEKMIGWLGLAGVDRAADVGCGPGVVTSRLVAALGADRVRAIDPSEPFVTAARRRCPGVDVPLGSALDLPWDDDSVDLTVAQLVVAFLPDPVAGLREMLRVTRPGGRVAVSVWDLAGERAPLSRLWRAATSLWPDTEGEAAMPGASAGDLGRLLRRAGGLDVVEDELTVSVGYGSFEEWWTPYTYGVGPAGDFVVGLDDERCERLKARCREQLPQAPFQVEATAWVALARA